VRGGNDVILAWTTPSVIAARRATSTVHSCFSGRSVYIPRIASRSLRDSGSRMCGVVLRARLFRQGIPRRGISAAAVCMVQTETGAALRSSPAREQQFRGDPFLLG
jgi:hypothetical protein